MTMSKERLEEIERTINIYCKHKALPVTLNQEDAKWIVKYAKEQACRVVETVNRNKELEYASKYNGELNEFLQKRKLPPNTLGRHVVDVVMDYVEELEETNKRNYWVGNDLKLENLKLEQQNKRYREAMQRAIEYSNSGRIITEPSYVSKILLEALEESI